MHNAAICGRSEMALFLRLFAQNVTAHGDPQDGLVMHYFLFHSGRNDQISSRSSAETV